MGYSFNLQKTIQSAAYLVKRCNSQRHSLGCILKMLYLADRKSIQETSEPITGDQPHALEHGMILSHTLNLINGRVFEDDQPEWDLYFKRQHYDLCMISDPGEGRLSKYDRRVLDKIWEDFGQKSFSQLREYTHSLPEYEATYREGEEAKGFAVHLSTLLDAVGRSEEYEDLSRQKLEDVHISKLFAAR